MPGTKRQYDSTYMSQLNSQKQNVDQLIARGWVEGEMRTYCLMGSVWDDEKTLQMNGSDGSTM